MCDDGLYLLQYRPKELRIGIYSGDDLHITPIKINKTKQIRTLRWQKFMGPPHCSYHYDVEESLLSALLASMSPGGG